MTVAEAHDVVEAIEGDLAREFPGCEVLIHLDPEGRVDHPGDALRETDETREPIRPMTELKLIQVDAFADRPFTGNPAAVMPLDAWLPDEVMQAIAEENNLAETAFTIPDASGEADYELRWFTPTVEIALCGHATLASGHVLIGDAERIRFRTRQAGILEVRARRRRLSPVAAGLWPRAEASAPSRRRAGLHAGRDALARARLCADRARQRGRGSSARS